MKKIIGMIHLAGGVDQAKEQLAIVDGCIIGSAFKPYDQAHLSVSRNLVKKLVDVIRS